MSTGEDPDGKSMAISETDPWPGLLAYQEADCRFFRGRDADAETLSRLVLRERCTILFGNSGLGKTSLLQAGLFPLLRSEQLLPIYVRFAFDEESSLNEQIFRAIELEAAATNVEEPSHKDGESLWEYFHRTDNDFWNERNRILIPVLVFDQFEEIFTKIATAGPERDSELQPFLDELADLVEGRPSPAFQLHIENHPLEASRFSFNRHHYKIVLSLREDFLPELDSLTSLIPSLMHNRLRLRRMDGRAALEVVTQVPKLLDQGIGEKVVRFVAAAEPTAPLEQLELEPALLSVVCRELNSERKTIGENRISEDLLKGSQDEILNRFYERSVADLPDRVRAFVEDRLVTVSGFRDSVALENALAAPGITREILALLADRRLVRVEERGTRQRIELTHDLLTGVVAECRNERHRQELATQREQEAIEKERQRRLEEQAKSARRLRWLSVGLAFLTCLALFSYYFATEQKALALNRYQEAESARQLAIEAAREAQRQQDIAQEEQMRANKAREEAERLRRIADDANLDANRRLERITERIKLRQAVLSKNEDVRRKALLDALVDEQIKFRATGKEYPYKARGGQPTFKFQIFPRRESLHGGFGSIALITYIMEHPSFQNRLILTGPDSNFTGTYDGVGCLFNVTAVIEYADPDRPIAIAPIPMCGLMEWNLLKE